MLSLKTFTRFHPPARSGSDPAGRKRNGPDGISACFSAIRIFLLSRHTNGSYQKLGLRERNT